jgi:tetratricopeptide (TPR) repeat protein
MPPMTGAVRWRVCALFLTGACTLEPAEEPAQELFPVDGIPSGWRVTEWSDVAQPAPAGTEWSVREGVLRSGSQRGTWLLSEAVYDDFELSFEIRLTAQGNSGVALRAPARGDPAFDGLELQIADRRYNPEAKDSELTGGLYRALAPRTQAYRPEEWNRVEIRLAGSRLCAVLNGELIHDVDLAGETATVLRHDGTLAPPLRQRPRAGRIGFQHLSRGGGGVEIRNTRIRELGISGSTEEEIIWRGRHRAYAGDYEGSIAIYSRGLELFPDSYRLLRHRGHRLISTRRFDEAVQDLTRASLLIRNVPDEIEPDGMPNAAGIPRSTNHSNVEYHLGLALYCQNRYAEAESAWRRCLEYALVNDDMLCATLYWLHLSLLRQDRRADADAAITEVRENMDVIENHAYHDLLLMLRGLRSPEQVLDGHPPGSIEHATRAYGAALFLEVAGRAAEAASLRAAILAADPPASFGFIAAEADAARR